MIMDKRRIPEAFNENFKQKRPKLQTAHDEEAAETIAFQAASFREPYCSLLLNGAKTIETRKWPMLADHHGLLAVHCAYHEWDGADDVRNFATEVQNDPLRTIISRVALDRKSVV